MHLEYLEASFRTLGMQPSGKSVTAVQLLQKHNIKLCDEQPNRPVSHTASYILAMSESPLGHIRMARVKSTQYYFSDNNFIKIQSHS